MVPFHVIIPARYDSQRLPGKALRPLLGKPLIEHVYDRACESGAASITIATDDARIAEACEGFGAAVCMTAATHQSGTDRLAEVVSRYQMHTEAIVVNVQGDEPLMPAACITQVAELLASQAQAQAATLAYPLTTTEEIFDPNRVKLVMARDGRVLYFSRAPIPWSRAAFSTDGVRGEVSLDAYFGHIGLYAYRAGYLENYTAVPPSPLEQLESLEQLRILWHGGSIYAAAACDRVHHGVDTEADLPAVEAQLAKLVGR